MIPRLVDPLHPKLIRGARRTRRALWILAAWAAMPGMGVVPALAQTVPLPAAPTAIPSGPLGEAIRHGQRIVNDTRNTVKPYVQAGLTCSNCHIGGGQVAFASPFAGLPGLFPEYRSRTGRLESFEERINDCFLRSMTVLLGSRDGLAGRRASARR